MGATITKSLRIPKETVQEIERTSRGRDFSAAAIELLNEALKMRRCPGILFADGPTGRRARVAGTGLDVWEVIATPIEAWARASSGSKPLIRDSTT